MALLIAIPDFNFRQQLVSLYKPDKKCTCVHREPIYFFVLNVKFIEKLTILISIDLTKHSKIGKLQSSLIELNDES